MLNVLQKFQDLTRVYKPALRNKQRVPLQPGPPAGSHRRVFLRVLAGGRACTTGMSFHPLGFANRIADVDGVCAPPLASTAHAMSLARRGRSKRSNPRLRFVHRRIQIRSESAGLRQCQLNEGRCYGWNRRPFRPLSLTREALQVAIFLLRRPPHPLYATLASRRRRAVTASPRGYGSVLKHAL